MASTAASHLRSSMVWLATQLLRQPPTIQLLRSLSHLLILYHERWIYLLYAKSCQPPAPTQSQEADVDLLLLADPQLIDRFTYPALSGIAYPIVRWASDSYNAKSWRALNPNLRTPWSLRRGKGKQSAGPERKGIIWVGDLFDGSRREMTDSRWNALVSRFDRLFPSSPPSLFIPGNHDMGLPLVGGAANSAVLESGHIKVDPRARQRFLQSYGTSIDPSTYRSSGDFVAASVKEAPNAGRGGKKRSVNARVPLYVSCAKGADGEEGSCPLQPTHEIILLDALDLVGIESVLDRQRHVTNTPGELPEELAKLAKERFSETYEFVESLAKDATREGGPMRILIQHVPLFRPATTSCHLPPSLLSKPHGVRRESKYDGLRQGADRGGTYQNEVGREVSDWVLSKIRPSIVFSGDDHDHCEVLHLLPGTSHSESDPTTDRILNLVDLPINVVPELTLKAFSITEGVRRPGFARLSLYAPVSGLKEGGVVGHDEGEAGSNGIDIADAAAAAASGVTASHSTSTSPLPSLGGKGENVARISYTPCLLPDQISIWSRSYPLLILLILALVHLARRTGHRLPLSGSTSWLWTHQRSKSAGLFGDRGKKVGRTSLVARGGATPRQVRLGSRRNKGNNGMGRSMVSGSGLGGSEAGVGATKRMEEWEMVDVESPYGARRSTSRYVGGGSSAQEDEDGGTDVDGDASSTTDDEAESPKEFYQASSKGHLKTPAIRFGGVLGSATSESFSIKQRPTFVRDVAQVLAPALILWFLLQLGN